jgi:hypothetical protein
MGTGKIIIQAFLQFRNLKYVYGVELSVGRYKLAEEAALRMVKLFGEENYLITNNPGKRLIIEEILSKPLPVGSPNGSPRQQNSSGSIDDSSLFYSSKTLTSSPSSSKNSRVLHLECGDMFHITNMEVADIVMLETDIPAELHHQLCHLLSQMHEGARTLTYLDLKKIWSPADGGMWFKQLESNRFLSDRFPTSWSVQRGHHFFLWVRVSEGYITGSSYSSSSNDTPTSRSLRTDSPSGSNSRTKSGASDTMSSSQSRAKGANAALGNISKQAADKQKPRQSYLSRGGNCLPFTFDVLSFGFFSRWQRRRETSRDRENNVGVAISSTVLL